MELLPGDHFFLAQLGAIRDFTLKFEDIILGILPALLLLLTSPFLLCHYAQLPVYVRRGPHLMAKIAVTVSIFLIEIGILFIYCYFPILRSETALAAAVLACVAALNLSVVIYAEHRHSTGSSAVLALYILLGILIDATRSRSYFYRHGLDSLGVLSALAAANKVVLLILEELPKTSMFVDEKLKHTIGKESSSGFWGRALFIWVNETLFFGFRNLLKVEDLPSPGPSLHSEVLSAKFSQVWEQTNKVHPSALAKACIRALPWPFLRIAIPRLFYTGFSFAQPFLLQRIIIVVEDEAEPASTKYGLIFATAIVFVGRAIARTSYTHHNNRFITSLRSILVAEIYKQTLDLDQAEAGQSAAVTLMSTDIDGIVNGLPKVHDLWSGFVEIAIGLYALSTMVRRAAFVVIAPVACSAALGLWLGKRIGPALASWNSKVQKRVSKMSVVLSQIKPLRMMGLGPLVTDDIQKLRVIEMEFSKKYRVLTTIMMTAVQFADLITPILVIGAALFGNMFEGHFTASQVFPTLSIISIIQHPLLTLLMAYPTVAAMLSCVERIQGFLLLPKHQDTRVIRRTARRPAPLENAEHSADNIDDPDGIVPNESTGVPSEQDADIVAVQFHNAYIAPQASSAMALANVELSIPQSTITAVVGSVGCGKSTLLHAILGEANIFGGHVSIEEGSVAYCGQTAWLQNATVQENIVCEQELDVDWYLKVLEACCLIRDVNMLPNADETTVGSEGIKLSGGQRQRIALARAVYSRASLLLLDDVFSALDRDTATSILSNLFGKEGLLKHSQSTVIFATHLAESLDMVDQLLVVNGANGNYSVELSTIVDRPQVRDELVLVMQDSERESKEASTTDEPASSGKLSAVSARYNAKPRENGAEVVHKGDFKLYMFYFSSMTKWMFGLWLVSVLLVSVGEYMPEVFVRIWLEVDPGNNEYYIGYALISLGDSLATVVMQGLFYLKLVPDSAERLHKQLLGVVMTSTLSFLASTESGSILNRFSQDMTLLCQSLPASLLKTLYMFFNIIVHTAIVFSGASYAAAVAPLMMLMAYAIQLYYLRTSRQVRALDLEAKTPLYTLFKETTAGLLHIRGFKWKPQTFRRCLDRLDYSQKAFYALFSVQQWLCIAIDLACMVVAVTLVSVAFFAPVKASPAALGLSFFSVIGYSQQLALFIELWTGLEISMGALARTRSFLDDTPVETNPDGTNIPADWPQRGDIEVKNLTAGYTVDGTFLPVLRNVSLDIRGAQRVGILGRTGSGKSSLVSALLNMLDYRGTIFIDGLDITTVPPQLLRSRITTISQDPVILDGSIRLNLVPCAGKGSIVDDPSIINVLSRLDMYAHVQAAGGLNAPMSDMGLSDGQRQLIAIARAMLHHLETQSAIILLDEATSHLDAETEKKVQAVMKDAFHGSTVIAIAHQYEAFRHTNFVVELGACRITGTKTVQVRQ